MNAFLPRFTLLLALAFASPLVRAADTLDMAEQSASEWVKLRVETTRLESDWRAERELVMSMAEALKERATALEEKRDLARAKTAKDREELEATRAKNKAAADDLQALEARLKALTQKLLALRPGLPPRLSEALEMSYRSLATAELPIGERMQLAMNVLNRCAQFNRMITAGDDVLRLNGEAVAKSVQVIYWGLSHGYALDRSARKAWLGSPGPEGWRWQPQPEAFDAVVQLLAIANDKADPDFVTAPAVVIRSSTETVSN